MLYTQRSCGKLTFQETMCSSHLLYVARRKPRVKEDESEHHGTANKSILEQEMFGNNICPKKVWRLWLKW